MNHQIKQKGFIIPLVLMLISVAIVLITAIYQRGSIFVPFITTMHRRQEAKMLAMSGVQIAMSQIAQVEMQDEKKKGEVEKKEGGAKSQTAADPRSAEATSFLSEILPILNQWQEFKLKKDVDGIEGEIKIVLSSEEGKINLNTIYDFAKHRFFGEGQMRGDWKKIMQLLLQRIQKKMGISANLFESFEKFLKQRHYKVNDATELLTLEPFRPFARKVFYEPPSPKAKDHPLYLLDIFTSYGYGKLQPWLLSSSIRGALDMKRTLVSDAKKIKAMAGERVKNFKSTINVAQDWNKLFQPMYGIAYQRLPKGIDAVLETTFDPKVFSVVSYGVVGDVMQRVYAIIERTRQVAKNKTWYDVRMKKFYWI